MKEIVVHDGRARGARWAGIGVGIIAFGVVVLRAGNWVAYLLGGLIVLIGLIACGLALSMWRTVEGVELDPRGLSAAGKLPGWRVRWDELAAAFVEITTDDLTGTRVVLVLRPKAPAVFAARHHRLAERLAPTGEYRIPVSDLKAVGSKLRAALLAVGPERLTGTVDAARPKRLVTGMAVCGVAWLMWLGTMIAQPDPDILLGALICGTVALARGEARDWLELRACQRAIEQTNRPGLPSRP